MPPRRFRTIGGFMPVTLLAAAVVVPLVGWMSGHLANEQLLLEARAAAMDRQTTVELESLGWRSAESVAGPAQGSSGSAEAEVSWMEATSTFSAQLGHGRVLCSPPPAARLREVMAALRGELARYPEGSLRSARFKRILACAGLTEGGVPIPSLPNVAQSLLLDVDAPVAYLRRLLHHEIFHFIDFADDSQLKRDPDWEALNDSAFNYGDGGRSMREKGSARLTRELPGFVTGYATSAVEEDKAEVFACLMVYPEPTAELARQDPIIARKIALLRAQVERAIPTLGQAFWTTVLGRRS